MQSDAPIIMPPGDPSQPRLEINTSRQFADWLRGARVSLGVTTYQAGKLFVFGIKPDGTLSIFERTLERCMGFAAARQGFWVASLYQLWYFQQVLAAGESYQDHDALFAPRRCYVTGDVDAHDIGIDGDDRPIFVNTLFSCLARPSDQHSFEPVWQPPFISRLAAEDRCHLNGLAMRDGRPAFVTAVGRTDIADGWRDHRQSGGIIMDVESSEIVATGLSMPHSPRWHEGRLWISNAGTGEFGHIDLATGTFQPIAFIPGFLRGMGFVGHHAIVATSRMRESGTMAGLRLQARLEADGVQARCGLSVIDLRSGDLVHWLHFDGVVQELYDVAVLPQGRRAALIGFRSEEIRQIIRLP